MCDIMNSMEECVLRCIGGMHEGKVFYLKSGAYIGRNRSCAIALKAPHIAALHCRLLDTQEGWAVICQGLNGMIVDGVRYDVRTGAARAVIRKGSILRIMEDVFEMI